MSENLIKLLKIFKSDVEITFSVIQLGIIAILVVFKFQVTVLINILLFIPFTKTGFHLVSMKSIKCSSDSNSLETALVLKSGEKGFISEKWFIFSHLSLSLTLNLTYS